MNYTDAVIYQPKQDIAGVRPYFVLHDQSYVDYFDSCGGAPEAELIDWAVQFTNPYREFIDIGSNIGTWGITYAALGLRKVVCYEAQTWLAILCRAGLALNDCAHVKCHDIGLWSEQDVLTVKAPHADGGGGSFVVTPSEIAVESRTPVYPLDIFNHEPGLIKIDVEGAELQVLKGARKTIQVYQPRILFESWQDERGQQREETFRYLHDVLDYKTTEINRWPEMNLAEPK